MWKLSLKQDIWLFFVKKETREVPIDGHFSLDCMTWLSLNEGLVIGSCSSEKIPEISSQIVVNKTYAARWDYFQNSFRDASVWSMWKKSWQYKTEKTRQK